jgi:hypothetical protein
MLSNDQVLYKVLLPKWIWEEAKNKEDLKRLVLQYMQRYPEYTVKSVKDGFAICIKK